MAALDEDRVLDRRLVERVLHDLRETRDERLHVGRHAVVRTVDVRPGARRQQERDDAQAELAAYRATGLTPDQISAVNTQNKTLQKTLAGIEAENKLLGRKVTDLQTKLDRYTGLEKPVYLPAALKGKVLVFDPKWNFVILNVGGDQGVLQDGELLVNRNGKLVAKIKVSSVQKDRCVANVVPGWQIGELIEGDQVIPAHPAES